MGKTYSLGGPELGRGAGQDHQAVGHRSQHPESKQRNVAGLAQVCLHQRNRMRSKIPPCSSFLTYGHYSPAQRSRPRHGRNFGGDENVLQVLTAVRATQAYTFVDTHQTAHDIAVFCCLETRARSWPLRSGFLSSREGKGRGREGKTDEWRGEPGAC